MRRSIPIIAAAPTRSQGLELCREQGIVAIPVFYQTWMRDDRYLKAMLAERERIQGQSIERLTRILAAHDEEVLMECIKVALSERRDKMRAIEAILNILGYDTGRGARVSVTTNIGQVEEQQKAFKRRLHCLANRFNGKLREKFEAALDDETSSRN